METVQGALQLLLLVFITFIEPQGASHGELNQPSYCINGR